MDIPWLNEILPLMRCPASKQSLRHATVDERRAASLPEGSPALVSEDGQHLYPVSDGMLILLPPELRTNIAQRIT